MGQLSLCVETIDSLLVGDVVPGTRFYTLTSCIDAISWVACGVVGVVY